MSSAHSAVWYCQTLAAMNESKRLRLVATRPQRSGNGLSNLPLFRNLEGGPDRSREAVGGSRGQGRILCANCARWAFSRWRGWAGVPRPDPIPDVPELVPLGADRKECLRCAGTEGIEPATILYDSYISPGNTGLPEYLFLKITPESEDPGRAMHRLGLPYVDGNVGRCSLETLSGCRTLNEEWRGDQLSLDHRRDAASDRVYEMNRAAQQRRNLHAEKADLRRQEKIRRDAVFHEWARAFGKTESAGEVYERRAARKDRQATARLAKQTRASGR